MGTASKKDGRERIAASSGYFFGYNPWPSGVLASNSAILRVQCPDRKGLDVTLADFIFRANGNILHLEQQ
jgi:hypothetical protein